MLNLQIMYRAVYITATNVRPSLHAQAHTEKPLLLAIHDWNFLHREAEAPTDNALSILEVANLH